MRVDGFMKHNWLKADSMWLLWTGQWSVQYAKFTLELVYAHQPYAQPNGSQAGEGIRVPNSFRQQSQSLIKLMHFSCHPLEDFLLFFVQCAAYSDILFVFIERKGRIFIPNRRLDASGCQWGRFPSRSCCIVCLRQISAGLLGTLYQPDAELLMHWPCVFVKYLWY